MNRQTPVYASLVLTFAAPAVAAGSVLGAQDTGRLSDSPWRWRWTPLRPIGGLGLPAPVPTEGPRALELPLPVVGQGWSARNPVGLSDDIREDLTRVTLATHSAQGRYRVATSPANLSSFVTEYGGWRRLHTRSAVIGRVAIERASQEAGNRSVLIAPDLSSPFVPTDTNAPATKRTRVTLEGGQGIGLGRWRLGIALGYEGTSDNAERSRIALVRRSAIGAVSAGAALTLGATGRIGLTARRVSRNETANVFPNPGVARLYLLDGCLNVNPQDYVLEGNPFFRRADRVGDALGVDASGRVWSAAWSAWANRERAAERQIALIASNVPTQRWTTTGLEFGATAQRKFGSVLATVLAAGKTQHGVSVRAPVTSRQFEADASRLTVVSDIRWAPSGSAWGVASVLRADRQSQRATDRAARTSPDISAWSPAADMEFIRSSGKRLSYSAGIGAGYYTPIATIPSIAARGALLVAARARLRDGRRASTNEYAVVHRSMAARHERHRTVDGVVDDGGDAASD